MRIGSVLRKWRTMSELSIREVAAQIGVAPATLSRIELGNGIDAETIGRLLAWLMLDTDVGAGTCALWPKATFVSLSTDPIDTSKPTVVRPAAQIVMLDEITSDDRKPTAGDIPENGEGLDS